MFLYASMLEDAPDQGSLTPFAYTQAAKNSIATPPYLEDHTI